MQSIPQFTEPINRYPDCVFLKLNGSYQGNSLCQDSRFSKSSFLEKEEVWRDYDGILQLKLSIRFGGQQIKVRSGHLWFGLRRGELKLRIMNGTIPIENQCLTAPFENEIALEIQDDKGIETEGGLSVGITAKAKDTRKISLKKSFKTHMISTRGSESEPIWIFEAITQQHTLKGQLSKIALGSATVLSKKHSIMATFEVRNQNDVQIIDLDGLWPGNIGRNKLLVIFRKFFLSHIKIKPYLSYTEFNHG
jgi:hypothetical protein